MSRIVRTVDRKPASSAAAFADAVRASADDNRVLLLISQNGMSRYLVLSWR